MLPARALIKDHGTGELAELLPNLIFWHSVTENPSTLPDSEGAVIQVKLARVVEVNDLELTLADMGHYIVRVRQLAWRLVAILAPT